MNIWPFVRKAARAGPPFLDPPQPDPTQPIQQVRKTERKALAEKDQDQEWLSYELRAYRARYSQIRDERDRLKV